MNFIERFLVRGFLSRLFVHWKSSTAGIATTVALVQLFEHAYKSGMSWQQWLVAALPAVIGVIMQDVKIPKAAAALLFALLLPLGARAQTPTPPSGSQPKNIPAPVQSNLSFNVGASAFGLGGTNATPASDVTLELNPGFKGAMANFSFRSDNLLAPGANLQFYGGGGDYQLPLKFASTNLLSNLKFHIDGSFGLDRIVPPSGPSQAHFGFMAGGSVHWIQSNGVDVKLFEIDALHTPGAPWGSNAPAISGGVSYFFGSH